MTPSENAGVRDDARQMNLHVEPCSEAALRFVDRTAPRLWEHVSLTAPKPSKRFKTALGAVIASILKTAWFDLEQYTFRTMSPASFTGERIGYRQFMHVITGLEAEGLIEKRKGSGGGTQVGVATRFRATSALVDLAKAHGIELEEWRQHFRSRPRPSSIKEPLVLRWSSTTKNWKKVRGAKTDIDFSASKPSALAQQVNELNAYFASVMLDPGDMHYAFYRLFNQGDRTDFDWNKGGRLYSAGDSYQVMKKEERKDLRLNGEPVVEIDLRASHLTILHALLRKAFSPEARDPYSVEGIPRDIVKAWVTMTLGYDRFQGRWSSDNRADFKPIYGDIGKVYPVKIIREKILDRLPLLREWPTCPIRWGDLQFIESEIIIGTVSKLAFEHDVPALPVHDSIIVPNSKEEIARAVLVEVFERMVGVKPAVIIK